jgi:mannose-6-phosphate isomerase-like protein (cupin superfamily)
VSHFRKTVRAVTARIPAMTNFTHLNLERDVEDLAPKHGLAPNIESRFARNPLGLERSGLSYYKMAPDFRLPFGHRHAEQEEVYVVLSGSARFRVEDEVVEMKALDALRVPGSVTRGMEAGPAGAQILAFGAPNTENKDAEMVSDFWPD